MTPNCRLHASCRAVRLQRDVPRGRQRAARPCRAARHSIQSPGIHVQIDRACKAATLAFITAVAISSGPACADVQTVTASEALQAAKPLKGGPVVNKGKVWLLLCGGAAGLFAATVIAENNSKLFPAIARANQAMQDYRDRQQEGDKSPGAQSTSVPATVSESVPQELSSTEDAVLKGMQAARERAAKKDEKV